MSTTDTDPDIEARRLRMRSWRRGMKEMDLILGPYADAELATMAAGAREAYAALLDENDQSLFAWVTGQEVAPARYRGALSLVRAFHGIA